MKEYKLKRWYPSIDPRWEIYHIYEYQPSSGYMCNKSIQHCVVMQKKELHPDFWELIEGEKTKPLFITDDNIKIFDDATEIIIVSTKYYTVSKIRYKYLSKPLNRENFKYFEFDINANKYIEDNKPKSLFTTEDGVEVFLGHSYILIDKEFIKHKQTASNIVYTEYFKKFKHESNADEYIWRNKPIFSYEDFIRWGNTPYPKAIEKLAKKRSEQ